MDKSKDNKLNGCFKTFKGKMRKSIRIERKKEKKEKVINAKLKAHWPYASPHNEKDVEMIQTSTWKAVIWSSGSLTYVA
jgi:hypothetical protein